MAIIDITAIEAEARAELAVEQGKAAKAKLKSKLQQIAASRAVTANLEREYGVLLRTVASDGAE